MDLTILLIILCLIITVLLILVFVKLNGFTKQAERDDDRLVSMLLKSQGEMNTGMLKGFSSLSETTEKRLDDNQKVLQDSMNQGFRTLSEMTGRRLADIQTGIDERLDRSLDERLDVSFRQVGERLEALYTSLGELRTLESGVASLNRTLSNVKTRGIFGEMQLGNILAGILDKSQYDENVATRPGSDERVEYAVRIPDKEDRGYILLPIDSKFPADIYARIIDAADRGDNALLRSACGELAARIKQEARTIRDKYIAPPHTTDFAVMFLPTEGIYAEVLRAEGLVEECQTKYKVVISGPTTLTALLNSLSVGFRYLTVNQKSEDILKTLGAFRSQFDKFDELISQTQKKLGEAQSKTDQLSDRSRLIKKQLDKVERLDYDESVKLLTEGGYFEDSHDA